MFVPFLRHWYVGAGAPEAVTENEAGPPAHTVCGAGWLEIVGEVLTVSVAALPVADPQVFVTTQSYDAASARVRHAMVCEAEVAPAMLTVLRRHWKGGAGAPEAAAGNVAEAPAQPGV